MSIIDEIKAVIAGVHAKTDKLVAATPPEHVEAAQKLDETAGLKAKLQAQEAEIGDILVAVKALDEKVTAALAQRPPVAATITTKLDAAAVVGSEPANDPAPAPAQGGDPAPAA